MQHFPRKPEVQLTLLFFTWCTFSIDTGLKCAQPDDETAEPSHIVMQLTVCKGGS